MYLINGPELVLHVLCVGKTECEEAKSLKVFEEETGIRGNSNKNYFCPSQRDTSLTLIIGKSKGQRESHPHDLEYNLSKQSVVFRCGCRAEKGHADCHDGEPVCRPVHESGTRC